MGLPPLINVDKYLDFDWTPPEKTKADLPVIRCCGRTLTSFTESGRWKLYTCPDCGRTKRSGLLTDSHQNGSIDALFQDS